MRKLLIALGCSGGVVLIVLALALALVDANHFRGTIEAQLKRSLQRKVVLGNIGLSVFPLSVRVDDFAVAEDPSFESSKPFISAKTMYIRAGLMALLKKRLDVQSAVLKSPSIELIKSRRAVWNFSSIGSDSSAGGAAFSIRDLRIDDGTIAETDCAAGKARVVYDRIALTVTDYSPGRRFTAEGSAHLPGAHKEEVAFAFAGTIEQGDGTLSMREVTAGPITLTGDGKATLRGNSVSIALSLRGIDSRLKRPFDIRSTAQYDRASAKCVADPVEIRMDRLVVRGRAEADTRSKPVAYRADLRADNAPLADLLAVANALGMSNGASGSGTVTIGLHVDGTGDRFAYNGTASAAEATVVASTGSQPLKLRQANLRLTSSEPLAGHLNAGALEYNQVALENATADFRSAGGVFRIDDVRANAFGGAVAGDLAMESRIPAPKTAMRVKLLNIEASKLLSATTVVKSLSGVLSGGADVQFTPQPGRAAAAGLNGTVRVLLTDGRLSGIDLLDHLSKVAQFVGKQNPSPDGTPISKLAGTMRIQSGVARTDDLQLDFDGGSLGATGSANLADETLDLSVAAVLTKDMSQRVGGSKVGGFMTTVMGSPRGELVIPAKVTGTFSKPRFAPDPARLVKLRFGNMNSAATTAQQLMNLFGKPKSAQQQDQLQKRSVFADFLDALGKRK